MVKKIAILLVFVYIVACGVAFAQSGEDAGEKAEEIHRRAMSDVIFIDEELKALYYQNVQIIDLLQDIRELLRQSIQELQEIKEKEEKEE